MRSPHHVHELLKQPFGGLTLTLQHIKQLGVANPLLENFLVGEQTKIGSEKLIHRESELLGTLPHSSRENNEISQTSENSFPSQAFLGLLPKIYKTVIIRIRVTTYM